MHRLGRVRRGALGLPRGQDFWRGCVWFSSAGNQISSQSAHCDSDDSLPTGPPPQIRILKRPTSNGVVSGPNSAQQAGPPGLSLAQREAEYAEARKRILGSASPEEEQEKPILDR